MLNYLCLIITSSFLLFLFDPFELNLYRCNELTSFSFSVRKKKKELAEIYDKNKDKAKNDLRN